MKRTLLIMKVITFLAIATVALIFATGSDALKRQLREEREARQEELKRACVEGAGQVVVVEVLFKRNDPKANEAAKNLFTYGLPWMRLCVENRPEVLEVITDNPDVLLYRVLELKRELERWR